MISSRSDYDFVSIDEPLAVNGDVMPLRSNAGALRAEDVAFCLEAAHERAKVAGTTAPTWDRVTRFIIGDRWVNCITALKASAANAVKPDYDFASKNLGDTYSESYLDDQWTDSAVDVSSLDGDVTMFATGSALRQQPISDVFNDLKKLTRFKTVVDQVDRTSEHYDRRENGDVTQPTHTTADSNRMFWVNYQKQRIAGESSLRTWSSEASADTGFVQFDVDDEDYVGDVKVVFQAQFSRTASVNGSFTSEWKYAALVEDAEVVDGVARVSITTLRDHAKTFYSNHYRPIPTLAGLAEPPAGDTRTNFDDLEILFDPTQALYIVNLGDHTKWWSDTN